MPQPRSLHGIALLFGAGCLSIAGLDDDYVVAAGGAPTTSKTVGTGASGSGGDGVAGTAATTASAGGGAPCPGTHEYVAVIADCIDLDAPDPDYCDATAGPGELQIDTLLSTTDSPRHGFVRFDLDATVVASAISAITLRMVVPMTANAESDNSGEVWQVAPFARSDLFAGDIANVEDAPVAGSAGAVAQGQLVEWQLPTTIVDGTSVYLALRPVTSNAAEYVNLNGDPANAPRLIVTCR